MRLLPPGAALLGVLVASHASAQVYPTRSGEVSPSTRTAVAATGAPARATAPSLEDSAEGQLRDSEGLGDARERRIRSTEEQLDVREKAAVEKQKSLARRERDLASREQQLGARERTITAKGPAAEQQRLLETLEARLASQERSLAAQERSYGPTLDAAQGRARDATTREAEERQEAERLRASLGGVPSRALQIDVRKQAVGARNRQLTALEAVLVARGEYLDALERRLRTSSERLDVSSRRLDARAERLDLLQSREAEPKPAVPAGPERAATIAAERKQAFTMVIKSPTAVVKERPSEPAAQGRAVQPGAAADKVVAAATVLMFPTPASELSELDIEALANVAKLAAKDRCELLIWARAKDRTAMAEAQRRATEIQTRALAAAPLQPGQVVVRITVRPGAKGVDVVASALRETARRPSERATPVPSIGLLAGESGNRQIRECVTAAQAAIEACVAESFARTKMARADGVLKLTISLQGRVLELATSGDLSGSALDDCLSRASPAWVFPSSDAGYVVDVPITAVGERSL